MKNKTPIVGNHFFDWNARNCEVQSAWMWATYIHLFSLEENKKEEFPIVLSQQEYDAAQNSVRKIFDDELTQEHHRIQSELPSFQPFFADDAIKEAALGFFIQAGGYIEGGEEMPFQGQNFHKDKGCFYIQARCYYQLSLVYKYFEEIQKAMEELFEEDAEQSFLMLDEIKTDIRYATGDILKFWEIEDHRRRHVSRKGGSAPKAKLGILSAVRHLVQDGSRKYSAERLWRLFKKQHNGVGNALEVNGYKIYFDYKKPDSDEERLFQISPNGKIDCIAEYTFRRYPAYARRQQDN